MRRYARGPGGEGIADREAAVAAGAREEIDCFRVWWLCVRGEFDRAGGAQWRVFDGVADLDAERLAVAEIVLDGRRHELKSDDDVVDAVSLQERKDMLHDGLVDDGHHRFRTSDGEGTQPRA